MYDESRVSVRRDPGAEIAPGVRVFSPIVVDPFGKRLVFRCTIDGQEMTLVVRDESGRPDVVSSRLLFFDEVFAILKEPLYKAIAHAIQIYKERDRREGNQA